MTDDRRPEGSREGLAALYELQIHFADVRRGIRSFQITRRTIRGLWSVAFMVGAFVLFGALVAPQVVRALLSRDEYASLLSARARQGERLQQLASGLEAAAERAGSLHERVNLAYLVYGLPPVLEAEAGPGRGGASAVPDSIYAADIRRGRSAHAAARARLELAASLILDLQAFEKDSGELTRTTPSISPLAEPSFVLTSGFGPRRSRFTDEPGFHSGLDLAAPKGTETRAAADGVVVFASQYPLGTRSVPWWRLGNLVAIKHGERFITLYGHLDEMRVGKGKEVHRGEVVGTVGETGWTTGPHLHYEVRRLLDGRFRPFDPRIYMLDVEWHDAERLYLAASPDAEPPPFEPLPRLIR